MALVLGKESLDIFELELGPDHPDVAGALTTLGAAYLALVRSVVPHGVDQIGNMVIPHAQCRRAPTTARLPKEPLNE